MVMPIITPSLPSLKKKNSKKDEKDIINEIKFKEKNCRVLLYQMKECHLGTEV